ncbi:Protein of unknown function, partial [Gryllus bimaculatus]
YAEFPDWNTDLIHKVLAAIYFDEQHNTNWHKVSENIRNSLAPDEIEKLWNNLIAKLEPPTFQCVLDSRHEDVIEEDSYTRKTSR